MLEYEAFKDKDAEILKKWLEAVQWCINFKDDRRTFSQMLNMFESISDGHLEHINVDEHGTTLLNGNIRPVHDASYRARQTARKFADTKAGIMVREKVIKGALTELAAQIVNSPKGDVSRRFCVDHQKPKAVKTADL